MILLYLQDHVIYVRYCRTGISIIYIMLCPGGHVEDMEREANYIPWNELDYYVRWSLSC